MQILSWGRYVPIAGLAGVLIGCGAGAAKAPAHSRSAAPASQAAAASSASQTPSSSSAPIPIKIAVSAHSSGFSFMYVAKDLGIFKKHGLDASIVVMNPPSAIAALNTGSIQFMGALGSAARAAEKGIPIRVVFVTQNNPAQELMAAPGIKDAKGLANHVIAGETSSSDVNALIYEGLLKSGLKPGSYKIVNAGHEPQQTAFLVSGRAAATPEGQPEIFKLEKQGFHPVVNFSRIIQMPYQGLATSQKYIANDPELIKRVDQASLDAVNVCKNQPQLFEKVMEQEFKMTPAEAQQTFEFLKPTWTSNGRPSTAAIQTEMQLDQQFGKLPKLPQASQVYDFSLLGQG